MIFYLILAAACVFAFWPFLVGMDLWRIAVVASLIAAVLRTGHFASVLSARDWYILQYGPLLMVIAGWWLFSGSQPSPEGPRPRIGTIFSGLALVCLGSSLWSASPRRSAAEAGLLLLFAVFMSVTAARWRRTNSLRGDMAIVYATIVALELAGFGAGAAGFGWAFADTGRFEGAFTNPNYTGILAAIGVVIGLYLHATASTRIRWIWLLQGLLLAPMLWSGCRGAVIGVAFAVLYLAFVRAVGGIYRLVVLLLMVVAAGLLTVGGSVTDSVLAALNHTDGTGFTSGRTELWSNLLGVWQSHWLEGIGYRGIQALPSQQGLDAHNILLSFLVEEGVIGLAMFCWMLALCWARRNRSGGGVVLVAGLICILAVEMTENSLVGTGNPVALAAWLVIFASVADRSNDRISEGLDTSRGSRVPDLWPQPELTAGHGGARDSAG